MKVKRSAPTSLPTGWFPKTEFQRIVDATYAYGEWRGGRDFHFRADRLRALVLLMRWSGLSIQDAVTLERERLSDDGKIFLYRAKTGVPVNVPVPPDVADILRPPERKQTILFWSGNGDPQTACKGWRRSLKRLFEIAKIHRPDGSPKRCHAHMFRDTFAVELLNRGVLIDRVSLLLGHSSVKVTERLTRRSSKNVSSSWKFIPVLRGLIHRWIPRICKVFLRTDQSLPRPKSTEFQRVTIDFVRRYNRTE